jgi:signal transduction histidine kinase
MAGSTFEQLLSRSHWRLLARTLLVISLVMASLLAYLVINEQSLEGNQGFLDEVKTHSTPLRDLLIGAPAETIDRTLTYTADVGVSVPFFDTGSLFAQSEDSMLSDFGVKFAYQQRLPTEHLQWVEDGQRYAPGPMRRLGVVPAHWQRALAQLPSEGVILAEPPDSPLFGLKYTEGGLDTLLIPIEPGRAVAMVVPRRWMSGSDTLLFAVLTFLILWACGLLLLSPPALLVGYWQVRREARDLARPLAELTRAAQSMQDGETPARLPLEGSQEIQALANAFNLMIRQLDHARLDLEGSRDELQQTLDAQREWMANVSHDLRTPLATISGYAEVLERDHPELQAMGIIRRETANMGRLVDDLFELARLEASRLPLYPQPVALVEVLQQTRLAFAKQAWDRGVLLKCDHAVDAQHPVAKADPQRLAQILSNLVTNAIRHTEPGGYIALQCGRSEAGVWITVSDSGSGIAVADLPRVFERSFRGDRARRDGVDRRHAGLGLTISYGLAQAMGGELTVVSTWGEGSTFTLLLPSHQVPT